MRSAVGQARNMAGSTERRKAKAYPGSPAPCTTAGELPFHPVEFRKDTLRLSFFSMVTTVGAPLDITAQELRIEAFFPADDQTERFARDHLGGTNQTNGAGF